MSVSDTVRAIQDAVKREESGDTTAHAVLLDEVQKLQLAVTTPAEKMMRLRFQCYQNSCVRVAQELGILQTLRDEDRTMSAAELSKATGADEMLIVRIMRLVVYIGLVDSAGPAAYMPNIATTFATTKGSIGDVKYYTDIVLHLCSRIGALAADNKLHPFPSTSESQLDPHTHVFGTAQFPWMGLPENRPYGLAFEDFMTGRRATTWSKWFEVYPATTELPKRTLKTGSEDVLLVDIAGGQGFWTQQFRDAVGESLPGRCVVQDQEFVLEDVKLRDVETMVYDFHTPQPVRGARAYFLRAILHDWPDEVCRDILRHTIQAMADGYSTLLISEYVLPEGVSFRQASLDIALMFLSSGIERDEKQWRTLLDSVGLRIVKIWTVGDLQEGNEAVIECEKA